ncbi:MAG: recombinase A [Polyangiaceae bacterium]
MAALSLELLASFGNRVSLGNISPGLRAQPDVLSLGWPELEALLPEGGFPRGSVVELASPHAIGGSTRIALSAVRAAQTKDPRAWCAWIDPEGTLYAPGITRASVDLRRLFVVRPPRVDLGRIAVKVAAAGAFEVIVIDMDPVRASCTQIRPSFPAQRRDRTRRRVPPEVLVRKLALAAVEGGANIFLLTDVSAPRATPWPVALRLEVARRPDALAIRVAKDRRGKMSLAKTWIPLSDS